VSLQKDFIFIFHYHCSGYSELMNPLNGEPWSDPSYTWTSSIYLIPYYR